MKIRSLPPLLLAAACSTLPAHEHDVAAAGDARVAVRFPEPLRSHTLANMRDHLATLQRIQQAMAEARFEAAAELAESRLGLTSLTLHGAHDVARFMPQGMQDLGTGMHRAASRFAIEATNAAATGDLRKPLATLAEVTSQCVACHAAYRLE
jgi:hypothetical protein